MADDVEWDYAPLDDLTKLDGMTDFRLAFQVDDFVTWDQDGIHGLDSFDVDRAELVADGRHVHLHLPDDKGVLSYPVDFRFPVPAYLGTRRQAEVTMTTYRRADGELIYGEYGWVADIEYFDDQRLDMEGVKIVREVWARTEVEEIHLHPDECFVCDRPWHGETCDEEPDE